tara:strand:- start:2881 stop:3402 length:522 start_codon:yes stop_codon:yes gene_type:complete
MQIPTSLPYDNCQLNLEYIIGKNREISISSNMILLFFLFVTYSLYSAYNSRITTTVNIINKYITLISEINSSYDIFDLDDVDITSPDNLLEYFIENHDNEGSEASEASEDSDEDHNLIVTLDKNNSRRVLRSDTRRQEVEYKFDRDYQFPLVRKRKSKSTSNLGISGKNWHLD